MGAGEVHTGSWWRTLRQTGDLEDQGLDGEMVLKWMFKMFYWNMDCVDLTQDRDRWKACVNAVTNWLVPQIFD
jgi:hypothetical protein